MCTLHIGCKCLWLGVTKAVSRGAMAMDEGGGEACVGVVGDGPYRMAKEVLAMEKQPQAYWQQTHEASCFPCHSVFAFLLMINYGSTKNAIVGFVG